MSASNDKAQRRRLRVENEKRATRIAGALEELRRGRNPRLVLEMLEAQIDIEAAPRHPENAGAMRDDVSRLWFRIMDAATCSNHDHLRIDPSMRARAISEERAILIIRGCAARVRSLTRKASATPRLRLVPRPPTVAS